MQDLAGYALDLGDIVAKAGVSALVGAEAKALWDRYKQTRRKPFTAVDAENAARTLIRLEYPSAELLTDPSVRRTDTDNGWVVRLTSHASSRVFSVRIDDKRGLGQIEYESL
jgi:hypothetical protein